MTGRLQERLRQIGLRDCGPLPRWRSLRQVRRPSGDGLRNCVSPRGRRGGVPQLSDVASVGPGGRPGDTTAVFRPFFPAGVAKRHLDELMPSFADTDCVRFLAWPGEWTADGYDAQYYAESPRDNHAGLMRLSGDFRVILVERFPLSDVCDACPGRRGVKQRGRLPRCGSLSYVCDGQADTMR